MKDRPSVRIAKVSVFSENAKLIWIMLSLWHPFETFKSMKHASLLLRTLAVNFCKNGQGVLFTGEKRRSEYHLGQKLS